MTTNIENSFVVYTAIANKYDYIRKVPACLREMPFICFTDDLALIGKNMHGWELRSFPDNDMDPTRRCRDLKINPHIHLPNYRYSLWVDSSIQLLDPISQVLIRLLSDKVKISALRHRFRNCVYEEADACLDLLLDDPKRINGQVAFLRSEGYPKNNGLAETGILFREHMDPSVIRAMTLWNELLVRYSKRDQLGFNYSAWKTGFPINHFNDPAYSRIALYRIGRHRSTGLKDITAYIEAYSYLNPFLGVINSILAQVRKLHRQR